MQAHTDNGPIFSPPWSPARPIIKAQVAEEQELGIIVLTLQARDPMTGLLISHFELVEPRQPEVAFHPEPAAETPLESLFDDIVIDSIFRERTGEVASSVETSVDTALSFIKLDTLTGEISFKKRADYEEMINHVKHCLRRLLSLTLA